MHKGKISEAANFVLLCKMTHLRKADLVSSSFCLQTTVSFETAYKMFSYSGICTSSIRLERIVGQPSSLMAP